MSRSILNIGAHLTAFEIDPAYCDWLIEYLGPEGLELIAGDVTKTWPTQWVLQKPDRVLGNLPYNAASAIIAAFIESDRLAEKCVFTVQDEMGLRMTASPGTKDYSSFSVLCQTGASVTDGGRLSPGSFYPAPRVRSRIIVMKPARPWGDIADADQFRLLVRSLFASRRKTLSNNILSASRLKGFPEINNVRDSFSAEGITLDRRPETVSPGEWVSVSNRIVGS
jgi:16S rRNA (adenine1518-N6/adenine1519-N6)-dimethyltransferase